MGKNYRNVNDFINHHSERNYYIILKSDIIIGQTRTNLIRKSFLLLLTLFVTTCFFKAKTQFIEFNYTYDDTDFPNPNRGFLNYTGTSESNYYILNADDLKQARLNGQAVSFRYYYLSEFLDQPISESYLNNMETDFKAVRDSRTKLILRFAYSIDKIPGKYDATPQWVYHHMEQLKPVLEANADVISVVEAGFVGMWGEWFYTDHFGDFLEENYDLRRPILDSLLNMLPEDVPVSVRLPRYKYKALGLNSPKDTITLSEAYNGSPKSRIGYHLDCFLQNENNDAYYFDDDEAYMKGDTKYIPVKGETCADIAEFSNCEHTQQELRALHFTFLCNFYHPDVISRWKSEGCWNNISRDLGYRFFLKRSRYSIDQLNNRVLHFELFIDNYGYAAPFSKYLVDLILKNKSTGQQYKIPLDVDPRYWFSDIEIKVSETVSLPQDLPIGDYAVYLKIGDDAPSLNNYPEYSIRFANIDMWEPTAGYNHLFDIQITDEPVKVNNPPQIEDQSFTLGELENTNIIGQVTAADVDEGDQLSFSISSGNQNNIFDINSSTGVLTLSNSSSIDFSQNPVYKISVVVYDNGSPSLNASALITINLIGAVTNATPSIEDQSFNIYQNQNTLPLIGRIVAVDPDTDQTLSFTIISGNENNDFEIDPVTGQLSLINQIDFYQNAQFTLGIRVTDNAETPESDQASVVIHFISQDLVYFINSDNSDDPLANGSYEHPYNSWKNITWQSGAHYLQKKGTIANEEKLLITADSVFIGAYGEGEIPVITSKANDYAIRVFDKKGINIKNLNIIANEAIAAISFIGSNCKDNSIENCILQGSQYGIRTVDGENLSVKYNTFSNQVSGIYSYVSFIDIYYNVFKNSIVSLDIQGDNSSARIYNNVFYNNRTGINSSYTEILVYNNIFYFELAGDVALKHNSEYLISDHNIFYPEQDGFIQLDNTSYDYLEALKNDFNIDINSFAEDPLFMDVYHNNFQLKSASPAIDKGKFVGLVEDYFGGKVPLGDAPDIGCNEMAASNSGSLLEISKSDHDKLNIFPNPFTDYLNLNIDLDLYSTIHEILVISQNGQVVFNKKYNKPAKNLSTILDLRNLEGGLYILNVIYEGKSLHSKIIKK